MTAEILAFIESGVFGFPITQLKAGIQIFVDGVNGVSKHDRVFPAVGIRYSAQVRILGVAVSVSGIEGPVINWLYAQSNPTALAVDFFGTVGIGFVDALTDSAYVTAEV